MANGSKPQPAPQDVAVLVAYIKRLLTSDQPVGARKEPATGAGQKAKEA